MTKTLAFGDDHSTEADVCWSWITAQSWDGWSLEIVTAEPRADLRPIGDEGAKLIAWEPDSPRDPDSAGFGSVVHLHAEIDARLALISKPWDLVAIGPKGSGLLKRLHVGSASDWLLREPASPLLIARRGGPVRSVLVAADGSPHADLALDTLMTLPWVGKTSVRVLAVDEGHIEAEDVAMKVETRLSDAGVETTRVVRSGRPSHVILEECAATSPDLVVMGVRGHKGLERLGIGSTTSAVAGSGDFSLLVAHAEVESG